MIEGGIDVLGCVAASRRGDAEAFGQLVERYQRQVYGFILHMTGRQDVAEDLTQESFLAAWRGLPSCREDAAFPAWLTRIALNKVRSHARWQRLRRWLSLDASSGEDESTTLAQTLADPSREADPASAAADPNLERRIHAELAGLAPRQREILLLRAQGLELAEIAAVLAVAEGTVKATLFVAKRKLQDRLKDIL